jgi:hypothetical protein
MSTEHTQPARAELLPIELLASPFVRFAVGRKSKLRRMQTPGKRCFPEEVGQCWRDTLGPVIGGNLNDIKEFIKAQPPSTVIGIGYMSNAGVNIVQNFTPDHDLAVKAARFPRGAFSTMDSPYLSLVSLVKGWPQQNVRREVLMVSDGIDRLRGEKSASRLGPNDGTVTAYRPSVWMPPRRAKSARGTTSLFIRSSWDLQLGLRELSKIA